MTKVLVFSNDKIGAVMAGPGIRSFEFARALARDFDVTLMAPGGSTMAPDGVAVEDSGGVADEALAERLAAHDVVVTQFLPLAVARILRRRRTRVIYDLYIPFVERLGFLESDLDPNHAAGAESAELLFSAYSRLIQRYAISTGSAFICASERQRDLWLGMLAAAGRIDLDTYRHDPALRGLIDVVPFGLPSEAPVGATRPQLPDGIASDDSLLLWAGGIWNWLDPLTPIRAVGRLAEKRDDVKLLFLGLHRPAFAGQSVRADQAVALAGELGLLGRTVFFNHGWVPYDERHTFLRSAAVGVSAHYDSLETRYAFRTRLLDHFWCGLPTVTTEGDVLGDLVADRALGRVVGYEDVEGWVGALDALTSDDEEIAATRARVEVVRSEFAWPRVTETLRRLVVSAPSPPRRYDVAIVAEEAALRLKISLALGGPRTAAKRQARKVSARFGHG